MTSRTVQGSSSSYILRLMLFVYSLPIFPKRLINFSTEARLKLANFSLYLTLWSVGCTLLYSPVESNASDSMIASPNRCECFVVFLKEVSLVLYSFVLQLTASSLFVITDNMYLILSNIPVQITYLFSVSFITLLNILQSKLQQLKGRSTSEELPINIWRCTSVLVHIQ